MGIHACSIHVHTHTRTHARVYDTCTLIGSTRCMIEWHSLTHTHTHTHACTHTHTHTNTHTRTHSHTQSHTHTHTVTCSPSCENGVCVSNNTCACSEGYTGSTCAMPMYETCTYNPCPEGMACGVLGGSHYCSDCTGANSETPLCEIQSKTTKRFNFVVLLIVCHL